MKISLYKYFGYHNRVKKTALNEERVFDAVVLKHDFSILHPVLEISGILSLDDIEEYNYMYIKATQRYYFVTIETLPGHIKRITGEVDVLMSFADQLIHSEQEITRNENVISKYIDDTSYTFSSKKQVIVKQFGHDIITPNSNFFVITSGTGAIAT